MNERSALHGRVYTRLNISERGASDLVSLFEHYGLLAGAKFGSYEPVKQVFAEQTRSTAVQLLHEQRQLIVVNRAVGVDLYVPWYTKRYRPWFWTLNFSQRWLSASGLSTIRSLCADILREFSPLQISAALSKDWFHKHDTHDEKGRVLLRSGASMELGRGLPGVYWLNGFGPELCAHFGERLVATKPEVMVDVDEDCGLLFGTYVDPDGDEVQARRDAEKRVEDRLGPEFFFDVSKAHQRRPRWRASVPGVTDATKL